MLSRHVSRSTTTISPHRAPNARNELSKRAISRANSPIVAVSARRYKHTSSPGQGTIDLASRNLQLGLRTQRPPDSLPDPKQPSPEIPDQEWEIRTGRAIYVLQETLPEFFKTGLITSINKITGTALPPNSASVPIANPNFLEFDTPQDDEEAIYSSKIRLAYTPPVALPPPFPKVLHVEGFQLYLASSSFIRHTMQALYSDLAVQNTKLVINTPPALMPDSSSKKRRLNREKSILLRQTVTGIARVSGKPGEWVIESTYKFSPTTGLIHEHIVNSIHPAPHQAVYDSLRLSLGKVLGFEWGSVPGATTPNGAAFDGKVESKKNGQ